MVNGLGQAKVLEPLNKGKHEGHKILRFPILRASKAYKNNLNTHKEVIQSLEKKRYSYRKRNKKYKRFKFNRNLRQIRSTGKEYTENLEQIIKQNDLSDFETVQLTNSVVKKDIQL